MGDASRYDAYRQPASRSDMDEAQALHVVASLLSEQPVVPPGDDVKGRIAAVLHSTARQLDAGRGIPPDLRLTIRRLANSLRQALDPRDR